MDKVLGIGNALVDIIVMLDDDQLLDVFGLPKGSMQLVDYEMACKVMKEVEGLTQQTASGGSAANTIHGLSKLGISTGFIGSIGRDEMGEVFRNDMTNSNIVPILSERDNAMTGRAITLVSQDAERTFATFLGAASGMNQNDITNNSYKDYKYIHVEGYLLYNHELLKRIVELAAENNMIISLDMASFNVVEDNLTFLKSLINEYIHIVFANEEEARVFTGKEPEKALNELAEHCDIAIVKTGSKGSLIKRKDEIVTIDIVETNAIDTTGAGDLYAAGFLYGLVQDLPLKACGDIGALLAARVIEVAGAKISASRWSEINKLIKDILE